MANTPANMEADLQGSLMPRVIDAMVEAVVSKADLLGDLDRAIGDGDHGVNMVRGFLAIADKRDELGRLPLAASLEAMGKLLVMNVGGASGPLYGSLLIAMGRAAAADAPLGTMIDEGIAAVKKRASPTAVPRRCWTCWCRCSSRGSRRARRAWNRQIGRASCRERVFRTV